MWGVRIAVLSTNVLAVLISLQFFWSFWPGSRHPNASTMNWAMLLFLGFGAFAMLIYRYHAKDVYAGPVTIMQDKREQ